MNSVIMHKWGSCKHMPLNFNTFSWCNILLYKQLAGVFEERERETREKRERKEIEKGERERREWVL
jgi:hypothetical protein